jgi:hypothetical protein
MRQKRRRSAWGSDIEAGPKGAAARGAEEADEVPIIAATAAAAAALAESSFVAEH